ncbi:hypothetical protein [Microbacterium sp. 1.5R]|uniref:hypothetical protein n=1 Tax=Microbacterium sp. 1.5R TaxID=1916917 RepID=UPI0011A85D51|nr:hypothetical protein [Microbacterium sp. 1.5R]
MNARTALAAPALIVAGLLSLTGCSAYDSLVHKYATSTFDDAEAFAKDAAVDATWVPADATDITVRTSTLEDAADAVILLTSESALPEECSEVDRFSAPSWVLDDAPDPYKAKTVFVCGDWSVVPSDDGWFGWTPNSAEERNAATAG